MSTPTAPFVLRPVEEADLDGLCRLVGTIDDSLTTLPNNRDALEARIHDSLRAFYPKVARPGGEHYLFVLAGPDGQPVGTSGLIARVGGFDPFYTYELRTECKEHKPLNTRKEYQVLHLKRDHKGPSEVCSLFLHKDFRSSGRGRLLSLGRFLFMRAFPQRFDAAVIAELRGYINDAGVSPFWESVAKPFFDHDFYQADILSGLGEKEFIEALMPEYPIYIPLLPPAAQAVIGQVHRQTEPARRLLEAEGFHQTNAVDIFDAGPLYKAARDEIRTVRESLDAPLVEIRPELSADAAPRLIATRQLGFRATLGPVLATREGIALDAATATALRASEGETLQIGSLRAGEPALPTAV